MLVNPKDRIGLVGKNGAGKSTLLKVIAGLQPATSGVVTKSGDVTIGYLPQQMKVADTTSLAEETAKAFDEVIALEAEIASLTAEIGLMRAGEQVAAMEMMGVDPVRRVLAPRFWGVFVSLPLLSCIFTAVGIFGAWVVGVIMIGVDGGAFWSQMQSGVDVFSDVGNSIIKAIVFAVAVGLISLYQGFTARPTPEGVSRATTRTVVISSLMVLGLDFIMTALMFSV